MSHIGPKEAQQRLLAKQKREHLNADKPVDKSAVAELRDRVSKIDPKGKPKKKKAKR
jgi:hypothetical protein